MDDIRVFIFVSVQTGIMVYVGLALFNIKLPRMCLALCTAILLLLAAPVLMRC